jgi:RNA polymerase sigma-70 factor (ECF subfamily)
MSDAEKIRKAQKGDQAAFEELVLAYHELVLAVASRIIDDIHAAEDICQEVFLTAYNKIDTLEEEKAFGAWLKKITLNKCLRHAQNIRSRREHEADANKSVLIDPFLDSLTDIKDEWSVYAEKIEHAVEELSNTQCIMLDMFYIRELSHKQIADFFQIPEGTVRRRLFDTRKSLQEKVDDLEGVPMNREKAARFLDAFRNGLSKKLNGDNNKNT